MTPYLTSSKNDVHFQMKRHTCKRKNIRWQEIILTIDQTETGVAVH